MLQDYVYRIRLSKSRYLSVQSRDLTFDPLAPPLGHPLRKVKLRATLVTYLGFLELGVVRVPLGLSTYATLVIAFEMTKIYRFRLKYLSGI